MNVVAQLNPQNMLEEKAKFLADFSYNPQFRYSHPLQPHELTQWGEPNLEYFTLVQRLIHSVGIKKDTHFTITTTAEVSEAVNQLTQALRLPEPIKIEFSDTTIARCSINQYRILFRTPIEFTNESLLSCLNHEVQTHWLRRFNDRQQPWYPTPRTFEMLVTEEGIANLHSFVEKQDKFMTRTWLNYCALVFALKYSFADTFSALRDFGIDVEKAWRCTLQVKRGLEDTSKAGGNTKGLIYLHGAVRVWHWLSDAQHNPHDLYIGKIALEELEKKKESAEKSHLIFPTFFDNLTVYRQHIQEIGELNQFGVLL